MLNQTSELKILFVKISENILEKASSHSAIFPSSHEPLMLPFPGFQPLTGAKFYLLSPFFEALRHLVEARTGNLDKASEWQTIFVW